MIRQIRAAGAFASLLLAGCSSSSPAGAPKTGDGAVADAGASASASDGGSSALEQAEAYANGNVTCASDADCCVVFDECKNQGLVVGAADKDAVASLCSQYDEYEDDLEAGGSCTGCVAPAIQVACVGGKCTGTTIPLTPPDGGAVDPSLSQNHCGSTNSTATGKSGSILGC